MDIDTQLATLADALLRNDTPAIVATLEALERLVPPDELTELVAPLLDERTLLSLALLL
jgi:hypothetical protein